jgi:biofilm PGA synthesis lipoprotein PgaB
MSILSRYFLLALFPVLMLLAAGPFSYASESSDTFLVLCYHDIRDDVVDHYDPDEMAVSTSRLIAYFAWLKGHGYHPVSIDDLIKARDGVKPLPAKAVLITFDDGLKSIYTRVFPLLKLFGYPAVVALVGEWVQGGEKGKDLVVKYGPRDLGAGDFLTWEQIREMDGSGLVEFASHSYNLHYGVSANPQGNVQPAPTAREYYSQTGTYETDTDYKQRICADLEKSVALMKKHLGKGPRVMVWPFGKYNRTSATIAESLGMFINFTMEPKINHSTHLQFVGRILVSNNPDLNDFIWYLRHPLADTDPIRIVQVDMDYLYDPDKTQQLKNLDRLLERIKQMNINHVFLQAFADPDGDGSASALYFPNRHLPVRADLFNRVAWQLKTRSGVKVFAWMSVSAFDFSGAGPRVPSLTYVTSAGQPSSYKRLSLFDPRARAVILEIYEDLAKHADFDGVLFHDDAFLGDYEDAGPQALRYYQQQWGLPPDVLKIRENPGDFRIWTQRKTSFLIDFTHQLTRRLEHYRAPIKTARNLYARPVLEPRSETWFAQSYPLFLKSYDFTVVMAMPYMEGAKKPLRWLRHLVKKAKTIEPLLKKTIFELQARDWRTKKNIPAPVLVDQMELLQLNHALNYGYYPDDFINGSPRLRDIFQGISLQTYPYRKK